MTAFMKYVTPSALTPVLQPFDSDENLVETVRHINEQFTDGADGIWAVGSFTDQETGLVTDQLTWVPRTQPISFIFDSIPDGLVDELGAVR